MISTIKLVSIVVLFSSVYGAHQILTVQQSEIIVPTFQASWNESRVYCEQAYGAKLMSVDTAVKDKLLVDLFLNGGSNVTLQGNTWISATEVIEGVWHWNATGEPLYYTRWFVGQPDDLDNRNCVYMATSALLYWRDANCSAAMYFMCERSIK